MSAVPVSVLRLLPVRWLFYLFGTGLLLIGLITAAGWTADHNNDPLLAYRDLSREATAPATVSELLMVPTGNGGETPFTHGTKVRFADENGQSAERYLSMVELLPAGRQQEVLRKGAPVEVLFTKGEQTNAIPRGLLATHPQPPFNPWPSVLMATAGIVVGVPFIVIGRRLSTERLHRMFPYGNVA